MITSFFLQVAFAFVSWVVGLLPVVAVPSDVLDSFNAVWGYVNEFSFLFPVSSLVAVLGIVMVYYIAILAWDIGLWIIHLFRGR